MKYIMFRVRIGDTEKFLPIIFPDELVHSDIAETIKSLILSRYRWNIDVSSAGSINIGATTCGGKSETLVSASDPSDAKIIQLYDYCHGIADLYPDRKA